MSENNSAIQATGTRKYVTIKIETNTLADLFNDMWGEDVKITNKELFAKEFAKLLKETLEYETLEMVNESMMDNGDESWCKLLNEEE